MGSEQSQFSENTRQISRNSVNFLINGKPYNVMTDDGKLGPDSRLVDFIRDRAGLKGTKWMCREGGCGACAVTVKSLNSSTGEQVVRSINSCLTPVFACDGFQITTIEHLGSTQSGRTLHPIQKRMVTFNGTQCGYCTPGWIMNMNGFMESKKNTKMFSKDIEDCMDGNICRCTGYRPILDAMKSFAVDAPEEIIRKCGDYQDNHLLRQEEDSDSRNSTEERKLSQDFEKVDLETLMEPRSLQLTYQFGPQWRYRIVAGNTGTGVFKDDGPYQAFVELNSIHVLNKVSVNPGHVILGGAVTISNAIEALQKASEIIDYEYCKQICTHWKRIAGTLVRNAATLAGNLMLKHEHPEFPSDVFLILATIGALLTIASAPSLQQTYTILEFLNLNMNGKIILSVHFPKIRGFHFRTFKITRRYQNSHAYVNAGFLMPVDPQNRFFVISKPSIVFGGIDPNFVHAVATELYFVGKLLNEKTIQESANILDTEIKPDFRPLDANPIYRKQLTQCLLYKFILGILGETLNPKLKSGGMDIERRLNYGKQSYDKHEAEWPLYQPIPKLEAPIQCTGEAEYVNDIHPQFGELHAALVTTEVAKAILAQVDASEALMMPGVVTFVDAKDIPGTNNYMSYSPDNKIPDVIFCESQVLYAGQPVGLIVAETREIALKAAKLVKLFYTNVEKPILDIPSGLKWAEKEKRLDSCISQVIQINHPNGTTIKDPPYTIKGEFLTPKQCHFPMETYVNICIPREDGQMDVLMTTQWMVHAQSAIAFCLAVPLNSINMQIRRLGGAFGSKLARATQGVCACAVAANKVKRPVRLVYDLESMMSTVGKRLPYLFKYNVGFEETGRILNLEIEMYCDPGATSNEATNYIATNFLQNCYNVDGWKLTHGAVKTTTPPNTFCRAPGSSQAIAFIENVMEHIAFQLKKDPMDVRMVNLIKRGDKILTNESTVFEEDNRIPQLLQAMKVDADLDERKKFIENFNETNRWKKRGMGFACMCHPTHYLFSGYNIFMAVYHHDASVVVSHCGIEMGQGINTKVAQVVAKQLKIPVDKIKIKPVTSVTGANTEKTATSVTSEMVCHAAYKACEILMDRLAPIKEKLDNPSWEKLITESQKASIDLTSYYNSTFNDNIKFYYAWGLTATEVEIDVLTGEYKIIRMDVISDAGMSLSPDVDVGQVEGCSIMGLGMWLTEKFQLDQNTGQVLTNRTWNYKPPAAKDIPEDFRVTLMKNEKNRDGVLGSKAVGEAPFCMSVSVLFAIKDCITKARADGGNSEWFPLDGPVTPEDIHRLCLTSSNQFTT